MIPADQLRAYHEQLARYCLQQTGACTAAELLEHMGTAAMMQGHPREVYTGLSVAAVAGIVRSLAGRGELCQQGTRNNARQARQEPLWRDQGSAPVSMPPAPGHSATQLTITSPAAYGTETKGGLSVGQKLALLQMEFDDMQGRTAREFEEFQARTAREWQSFRSRAARVLGLAGELPA
ncbi:hypothetical protein [Xanthomonas sp. 3498]|uniref:hypothetical protein n=1 Tax=Xanthomonas sp. 3498 TaxID=2663863 RepID=UPI00160792E6|nr:hypothetical protein [Xanthomonas sp. 3498]MBB5875869.1 hypothetical protein [Xanthomonas sp. 3498]